MNITIPEPTFGSLLQAVRDAAQEVREFRKTHQDLHVPAYAYLWEQRTKAFMRLGEFVAEHGDTETKRLRSAYIAGYNAAIAEFQKTNIQLVYAFTDEQREIGVRLANHIWPKTESEDR